MIFEARKNVFSFVLSSTFRIFATSKKERKKK